MRFCYPESRRQEDSYADWLDSGRQQIFNKAQTWLFKGQVKTNQGFKFQKKDYKKNTFIFIADPAVKRLELEFIPEQQNMKLSNPVLQIKNWSDISELKVRIDDDIFCKP